MSDLEKLIPVLNTLNENAFWAFALWWVGEYIITPVGTCAVIILLGYGVKRAWPAVSEYLKDM